MPETTPHFTTASRAAAYTCRITWSSERPNTLVVCCSDGRLQESTDEFLHRRLGIGDYDRIYMPGGPGALSDLSGEFIRANQYRSELEFLRAAHSFRQIVLIFHGAAEDGPQDSVCAHYRRILPGRSHAEIVQRQEADAHAILRFLRELSPDFTIQIYRAEVTAQRHVRFIGMNV